MAGEYKTAATANANPSDDVARAVQTSARGTPPVALTVKEKTNLSEKLPAVAGAGRGNYTGYNAADEVKNKQTLALGGNKSSTVAAVENPLDAYPSYTYAISLHVMTKEDYNTMVKSPRGFKPSKTLISSAGRYRNNRDESFKDDFYFDSLKINTVIGLNAATRATNAIGIDFTIIEPYGLTLLDRIMSVNNVELNGKNYLDMPYLLELNFYGSDDAGTSKKITEHTKWFPIKLIGFKIKASVKGSEYAIQAIPFNHGANLESIQAIKTRMEVTATTVGDYFSSVSNTATQNSVSSAMEEDARRKTATTQDNSSARKTSDANANSSNTANSPETPITVKTKSFTAAYNAWNQAELKNNNVRYADQIQFVFLDSEIAQSKIVDAKKTSSRRVGEVSASTVAKGNAGKDAATVDFNSIIHSLDPGTTVNDIINLVLPQSEYFLKQAIDSSTQGKDVNAGDEDQASKQETAQPVKMWKIIPSIELHDFDPQRNCWGKTITFYIDSYKVYQSRDGRLPKSPPPPAVKKYDYFYTGQNRAIINFDIDFNALYFTAYNVDRGKVSAVTGPAQDTDENQLKDKKDNEQSRTIDQNVVHPQSDSYQTGAGGGNARSDTLNAQSALQSIYTSAGGDMINVKLQIIGDPHYIKQDDLFVNPSIISSDPNGLYVTGTSSLKMDNGEIYCYLTFKTPTDFNDTTGLYDLDSSNKFKVSEFSGYYKVIKVESEFRSGKFTQTLELIRYPKQDPVNKSATDKASNTYGDKQRKEPGTLQGTKNPKVDGANVSSVSAPITPVSLLAKTEDAVTSFAAKVRNAFTSGSDAATSAETKLADVATKSKVFGVNDLNNPNNRG
jgi:hypothetical protein